MKCGALFALLVSGALPAAAQETGLMTWGPLTGFSGGWSQRGFYSEAGQLWDRRGLDFTSTRSRTVRFGGGGVQASLRRGATFARIGAGFYVLESITRDYENFSGVFPGYSVALAPGGRAQVGLSLGGGAALTLGASWLPRPRGEKLPHRPALSLGVGLRY